MAFLINLTLSLALCGLTRGCRGGPDVRKEVTSLLGPVCNLKDYSCAGHSPHCKCDPDCAVYGDCCFDSPHRANWRRRIAKCELGVYIIEKCPMTWKDKTLKYYCETYVNATDRFSMSPVYSTHSLLSYRNHYCAKCNGNTEPLRLWPIGIKCNTSELGDIKLSDLKYNKNKGMWGFWRRNSPRKRSFIACNTNEIKPIVVDNNNKRRYCMSVVEKCASDWTDKLIKNKCESYELIVNTNRSIQYPWILYRNIHCAQCNHINTSNSICAVGGMGGTVNFDKIFSYNTPDSETHCQKGEMFDPYVNVCRVLTCLPFQKMKKNKCV